MVSTLHSSYQIYQGCRRPITPSALFPHLRISFPLGLVGLVNTSSLSSLRTNNIFSMKLSWNPQRERTISSAHTVLSSLLCHSKSIVSQVTNSNYKKSQFLSFMICFCNMGQIGISIFIKNAKLLILYNVKVFGYKMKVLSKNSSLSSP